MNDSEIIKALECCKGLNCSVCPKKTNIFVTDCDVKLCEEAIDLIKRQQVEIERLKKIQQTQADRLIEERGQKYEQIEVISKLKKQLETAKSEAVREFAEKLKSMLSFGRYTSYEQIDNLVKEMTEDKENV